MSDSESIEDVRESDLDEEEELSESESSDSVVDSDDITDSDEESDSDSDKGAEDDPGEDEDDNLVDEDAELDDDKVVMGYDDDDIPLPKRTRTQLSVLPRVNIEPVEEAKVIKREPVLVDTNQMSWGLASDFDDREFAFTAEIRGLMYGSGDSEAPLLESLNLVEDIAMDFIREMTMKTIQVSGSRDRLRTDDLLFALRDYPRLRARALELLEMNNLLKDVKQEKSRKLLGMGNKKSSRDRKSRRKKRKKRKKRS